jgi:hypothetical protein
MLGEKSEIILDHDAIIVMDQLLKNQVSKIMQGSCSIFFLVVSKKILQVTANSFPIYRYFMLCYVKKILNCNLISFDIRYLMIFKGKDILSPIEILFTLGNLLV